MAVVVSVNRRGIQEVLHGEGPGGHVHRYVRRLGREGVAYSRAAASVRTGKMRASIYATQIYDGPRVVHIEFGTKLNYGIWQNQGTGIYAGRGFITARGGRSMPITGGRLAGPTRSGRLRPRRGRVIFAKKVRGIPPQRFLQQGLITLGERHPELRIRILK